ncbi:hypothetical protein BC629DRAFT_1561130 [Irpex lacteus]|nr:hypothetical protein BC629DRAFT_1561130 [Irpex lacteus]
MSDISRQASPRMQGASIASSPSRPSPLSRPHWPYSTHSQYSHRSASSASSSTSIASANASLMNLGNGWEPRSSAGTPSPSGLTRKNSNLSTGTASAGENKRHWSFTAFEWVVKDVHRLRDHVELFDKVTADVDDFEVLLRSRRWRMERERGARHDWAWEEDSEVWECPLPPLSSLLENPRIRETDSFVICVQIHCPIGPFFPHQPSASYVPKDLLDGLEAMLDNANTGDVQFVCLERQEDSHTQESAPSSPGTETPHNQRPSSSASTSSSGSPTLARKRVIYAHSDILTRRSEYFATMLNSSFAENATRAPGERKTYTIVVEEADFWVYANWILFKKRDNPKVAVEGVGGGWSAKSLNSSTVADEWGWAASFVETRSVNRARSTNTSHSPAMARTTSASRATPSSSKAPQASSSSTTPRPPPSPTRRSTSGISTASSSSNLAVPGPSPKSPSSPRSPNVTLPPPISTTSYTPGPHHPLSPMKQRQRPRPSGIIAPDPHPHPTPAPPPASALSMYQVAHRYALPGLAALSLEHMMSTITPESSFALLLASSTWDELHALVEDYIVDKWDEVSVSADFEQCCQEIAAGEWGIEGGKTLMALFRRLRSPLSVGRP